MRDRETKFMPSDEAKLMNDIWQAYETVASKNLPTGLCHLDMFADNTLWDFSDETQPTLTGLLDFTEVSVERFVMDVAITINDFCTTWGNANALSGQGEAVNFDDAKMQAFLQGYESKRALSDEEKKAADLQDVQQGIMQKWEYRVRWYGEDEEAAKAAVPPVTGVDIDSLLTRTAGGGGA